MLILLDKMQKNNSLNTKLFILLQISSVSSCKKLWLLVLPVLFIVWEIEFSFSIDTMSENLEWIVGSYDLCVYKYSFQVKKYYRHDPALQKHKKQYMRSCCISIQGKARHQF
jgi:hypothetical protein